MSAVPILLLAVAVLLIPGAAVHRIRPRLPDRSAPPAAPDDPLAVPSSLDVLAAARGARAAVTARQRVRPEPSDVPGG